MSVWIQLLSKFFPFQLSLVVPAAVSVQTVTRSNEGAKGILWAYAPKQKSLSGRVKRRELQYIIPLKTGITGCPSCGHPIMFPRLCGNCLRYVISREWEYRQKYYTKERLDGWRERWEAMKSEWASSPYLKTDKKEIPTGEIS